MKKRIIAMLLAVVMSMSSFAACSSDVASSTEDVSNYVNYTNDYNYVRYKSSGEIIKIDTCIYFAGIDIYEISINGWTSYVTSDEVEFIN